MIEINGKEYRNIQEQVQKNMDDIADLETNVSNNYYTKEESDNKYQTKEDTNDGHYIVFFGTHDCSNFVDIINHKYTNEELDEINELDFDIADPTDPEDQATLKRGLRILHDMIRNYSLDSFGYDANMNSVDGGKRNTLFWNVESQDYYIHLQDTYTPLTQHYAIGLSILDLSGETSVEETRVSYDLTSDELTITRYNKYPILKIQRIL